MINTDFLRTFVILAEEKHFSRTAARLNMTQPGVSQHLKKLEEHFGVSLLARSGHSVSLTEPGRRLLDYGRALFLEYENLRMSIAEDDPFAGHARFAAPGSFGLLLYDSLLSSMRRHPQLRLELVVMPTPQVAERVARRDIDIGFTTMPSKDRELEVSPFASEKLLLVAPKGYRGSRLEELRDLGFVHHPDGSALAERLLSANFSSFDGMGSFPVRTSINQINRILDPVAEGLGFSVVPEFTYTRYARQSQTRVLSLKREVRDVIYKITRRHDTHPSRFTTVETQIRKILKASKF